jgi:protein-S-isoprenylcysteine O-methyltransferase Ste14
MDTSAGAGNGTSEGRGVAADLADRDAGSVDSAAAWADRLFVWRGWGVIAIGAALLAWRWPPLPQFPFALAALPMVLLGVAFRIWARCYFTRGSDTRRIQAHRLIASGPYRRVRNPLYLGNVIVATGLLLAFTDAVAAAVMMAALLVFYSGVIRSEEAVLQRTWGDAYREFQERVPRWIPRWSPLPADPDAPAPGFGHALRKERLRIAGAVGAALVAVGIAWHRSRT